jgi:hypothetical protein
MISQKDLQNKSLDQSKRVFSAKHERENEQNLAQSKIPRTK